MKKLPEEARLKRGIQVLLNDEDQNDLRAMAAHHNMSLSGLIRGHVQEALDDWRKTKPRKKKKSKK